MNPIPPPIHLPARAATTLVHHAWATDPNPDTGEMRPSVRERYPNLGTVLDDLAAGRVNALTVANVWGDIDDHTTGLPWLYATWPHLTDALEELLMSTMYDPEGFQQTSRQRAASRARRGTGR